MYPLIIQQNLGVSSDPPYPLLRPLDFSQKLAQ